MSNSFPKQPTQPSSKEGVPPTDAMLFQDEDRPLPKGRMWNVDDVAYYFGISPQTVYRYVSEGRLKANKTFCRLRFRAEDILDLSNGVVRRYRKQK